ncbi:MAG TPA: multidrug efflux SMR transporter [Alphaproteobacteria bacterium]
MTAWIMLLTAGLLEIAWAISLKEAGGWTRFWPSVLAAGSAILSFVMLSYALKTLPVGTAYAIWVGIGAAGVACMGIMLFGENASLPRLLCIGLIVVGIVGLKLSDA